MHPIMLSAETDPSTTRRVRAEAAELILSARRDAASFYPTSLRETGDPRRSAWRTFRAASNMAARLSARNLAMGAPENAMLWAQVFMLLNQRFDRALGRVFSSVPKG